MLALLGILPVEVTIHKNSLNLFMNIISDKTSTEYSVTERQFAMRDPKEKSWFNYIRSLLETYSMPSVFTLFHQEISKSERKRLLNNSINSYVEASWKAEVESKPSLKYVNPGILKVEQSHPVWSTVRCNIRDNIRAQLKCKLLTGSYILQGNLDYRVTDEALLAETT